MIDINLADAFDVAAAVRGDEPAIGQGDRVVTWNDCERRAANLARWMLERGATRQGKVGLYGYNSHAYLEGMYASFKAGLVPFNVNYRYKEEELLYLLDNADAEILVVHHEFSPVLAKVLGDLPKVRGVLLYDDGFPAEVAGEDFEAAASADGPAPVAERSPEDLMFLYTGGTTGMPKGVMWRQGDLYDRLGGGGLGPSPATLDDLRTYVENPPLRVGNLVACPLMHGTGWFVSIAAWLTGGTVFLLEHPRHFDPGEFWASVERLRPSTSVIVGDSFAKPLLGHLDEAAAGGQTYDLDSLKMMISSGVMWSTESKQGLLRHHPGMLLVDQFSSSEALGMGTSIMSAAGPVATAKFSLGENTRLFDELLRPIETGPGSKGLVGVGGAQPVGYYKDPEKSARTFVEAEGQRYSIPGDWAVVEDDGVTLGLLGRGSVCINTGGEKVFPEEVEEVVKRHPAVRDVVVVGVPDERWGEAVTAVLSTQAGEAVTEPEIVALVKEHISDYKAPKHVVVVDHVYRSPSGKADFKATKAAAMAALGIDS